MTRNPVRAWTCVVVLLTLLMSVLVSVPASGAAQSFQSDDFSSGVLDPRWSVVDPVGDGQVSFVGTGTSDARLALSIPAGTDHDPWGVNRSLRVMQPAANVDFGVEARWTTLPSKKFQSQGILVQQDAQNWLRFDVHSTGTALRVFAGKTAAGTSSSLLQKTVSAGPTLGLRVTRVGTAWSVQYTNGSSWESVGTVQHALAVTTIGPFAGVSGTNPAWTAELDYFFDTAAPVLEEDGAPAPTFALTTDVVGQGVVVRSPDSVAYPVGTAVTLTAQAAPGWELKSWSGDASGASPTVSLTMNAARSVTATFVETVEPPPDPDLYPLTVDVVGDGVVSRSPAATQYEAGTRVTLTAVPAHGWQLQGWSGAATGSASSVEVVMNGARAVVATFVRAEAEPPPNGSTIVSDDFSTGVLDPGRWAVVDPVGDGGVSIVGAGTDDVRLALFVPQGVSHDAYNNNRSLRVMQRVADGDFGVAARFVSSPTLRNQLQGIIVEQDHDDWLRFDVHSTGSGWRLYAAKTVAGTTSRLFQKTIPVAAEVSLRVARAGSLWSVDYSYDDGVSWQVGGTATHALAVSAMGPFVGNSGDKPAFTAEVDWFFNTASPISPEDGSAVEVYPLDVTTVGEGSVTRSPSATMYPAGTEVSLTAVPRQGWEFSGWTGDASGAAPTTSVVMSGPGAVTATFVEVPPGPAGPPVIDVWYGLDQTFGATGTPQRWVNVLGNVSDADGVASLTYSLNGGQAKALRLGPNLRRLYMPGDFNVQIPVTQLPVGVHQLLLRAQDSTGQVSTRTLTVRRVAGPAPLPMQVDWSTVNRPDQVAQVVDGNWRVGADGLSVVEMGYDRTVAIGDMGWTDYEVTVPVTVRGLGPGAGTPQSGAPLVGMGLHWDGHTQKGTEDPSEGWFPTGAFAWFEFYGSGRHTLQGNGGSPLVRKSMVWDYGTTYLLKARVETVAGGVRYSYRYWPRGTPEPSVWTLSVLEEAGPGRGSVLLIAHHVDATFGTAQVNHL